LFNFDKIKMENVIANSLQNVDFSSNHAQAEQVMLMTDQTNLSSSLTLLASQSLEVNSNSSISIDDNALNLIKIKDLEILQLKLKIEELERIKSLVLQNSHISVVTESSSTSSVPSPNLIPNLIAAPQMSAIITTLPTNNELTNLVTSQTDQTNTFPNLHNFTENLSVLSESVLSGDLEGTFSAGDSSFCAGSELGNVQQSVFDTTMVNSTSSGSVSVSANVAVDINQNRNTIETSSSSSSSSSIAAAAGTPPPPPAPPKYFDSNTDLKMVIKKETHIDDEDEDEDEEVSTIEDMTAAAKPSFLAQSQTVAQRSSPPKPVVQYNQPPHMQSQGQLLQHRLVQQSASAPDQRRFAVPRDHQHVGTAADIQRQMHVCPLYCVILFFIHLISLRTRDRSPLRSSSCRPRRPSPPLPRRRRGETTGVCELLSACS
jgi:hypothetical protein